ncbi:DNA topoisomerase IB [Winogradskyella litorisediminis]|uniref:DNA topoisomerase n=1 Tax=Winogradskyella litorisediminis TaxID=1156618 RepID=A0ABW3N6L8_9FLAO
MKLLQIEKLKNNPKTVISNYNLVYSTPKILCISREKRAKKFLYKMNSTLLDDEKITKRIDSYAIPPAWENVKIAKLENAHLLATGYDAKKRKQYRYHPKWSKIKNQTKFYKMAGFAKALPKLRKRVLENIDNASWNKEKVLAIVIRLLEESHIRIGNTYYEKRNKTYGLSTLRTRHLTLFKNKFKLEFIGKKGKKHEVTLRNKKLLRLLNKCEEIPGWELFQYYDEDGKKQAIDSGMINDYIHETCGEIYSAKDFRTWSASLIAFETLKQNDPEIKSETKNKEILKAVDAAAEALNNTRNISRKYYIHPQIFSSYEDSSIKSYFSKADKLEKKDETELQPNELALLSLIENFQPNFN